MAGSMLIAASGLLVGAAPWASASSGHVTVSKAETQAQLLKQGLKFYAGKTILCIVPVPAGSPYDLEFRAVTAQMSTYLHATFNLENIGSGVAAQDALAHSAGNGLTIGGVEPSNDIAYQILNLPELNFNASRLVFLGGFNAGDVMLMATKASGLASFSQLLAVPASTPTKMMILPTSFSGIRDRLFMIGLGVHFSLLTAYPTIAALNTGFLRGDGQIESATASTAVPWITGNEGNLLALYAPVPKSDPLYGQLRNTPSFQSIEAKVASKLNKRQVAAFKAAIALDNVPSLGFGAPTSTPGYATAALRWAAEKGIKSSAVHSYFVAQALPLGFQSWQTQKQGLVTGASLVGRVQSLLGIS